jgi:hypothetical protein
MSYKIEGQERAKYLQVTVNGSIEDSKEDIQHSLDIFDLLSKFEYTRLLLDERQLDYKTNLIDQVKKVESLLDENLFPGLLKVKLAVVLDLKIEELGTFFEDYSANRGYNFKVFYDFSEALTWLDS